MQIDPRSYRIMTRLGATFMVTLAFTLTLFAWLNPVAARTALPEMVMPASNGAPQSTSVALPANADNTIYSENSELSNGIGSYFFAGQTNGNLGTQYRRALISFDLSTIPQGAEVVTATLVLHTSRGGPTSVAVHPLLTPWGEGPSNAPGNEGQGTAAIPPDATWTFAQQLALPWAIAGGDFVLVPSYVEPVVTANNFYNMASPQLRADVQAWVEGTAPNLGWILIGNEDQTSSAIRFDSRENGNTAFQPVLLVEYIAPTIIVDDTPTTGLNDGTVNGGEYLSFTTGINGGFGNVLGSSSQLHIDSKGDGRLNLGLMAGADIIGSNAAVIYIDTDEGATGFSDTSAFIDTNDRCRRAISGYDGSNRSVLAFGAGFAANYAICIDEPFAGLWQLSTGSTHPFVISLQRTTVFTHHYEMELTMADLGLSPGDSFRYVANFLNGDNAFRSDEFHGVDSSTVPPGNPGYSMVSLTAADYIGFTSIAAPNLDLTKEVNDLTPILGQTLVYSLTIFNGGAGPASGGIISDTIPTGMALVSGSITIDPPGSGTIGLPPHIVTDLSVPANSQVLVNFLATLSTTVQPGTILTNTATVTSSEVLTPVVGQVAVEAQAIPLPNLDLTKDVDAPFPLPGQTVLYTLTVSNGGLGAATGGVVSDTLPPEMSLVPGSITLNPPSNGVIGTLPHIVTNLSVPASSQVVITFLASITTPLPAGLILTNTASVTSSQVVTPATSLVPVTLQNAPPIAFPDSFTTTLNTSFLLSDTLLLANDFDANGDSLTVITDSLPVLGSFSLVGGSGNWVSQTVDTGLVGTGQHASLADINGDPGIAYARCVVDFFGFACTQFNLYYAYWDGSQWITQTVDSSGSVGEYASLAEVNGQPAISYYDADNFALKYAAWDGNQWQVETVDSSSAVGQYTSLAVISGQPAISYYNFGALALKYARWNGSQWISETVDTGNVGAHTSLVELNGRPSISYYDGGNTALKYAHWNTFIWAITTVDNSASVGTFTSLAIINNEPAISYYNASSTGLQYALLTGGSWHVEGVDNNGSVGEYTSLMETDGQPAISYYDAGNGALKYAIDDSGQWISETVDNSATVGQFSSLAQIGDDIGIAYHDETNAGLKYASLTPGDSIPNYTPPQDTCGTDSFTYHANDGLLNSNVTTVTINIVGCILPQAVNDTITTTEEVTVSVPVLANDVTGTGGGLDVIAVSVPSTGTVALSGTTAITYYPPFNFFGIATFMYTLDDGISTDVGFVTVTVENVNDAPIAIDDYFTTTEDVPLPLTILQLYSNDSDPDGDLFQIVTVTLPSTGMITVSLITGVVTYTPPLHFFGVATFNYIISDGVLTDTATVTVDVLPVNDPPEAKDDTATTPRNTPILIKAVENDTDPDGDDLNIVTVVVPLDGVVTFSGTKAITYTPDLGFIGTVTFTYVVSDGPATDSAIITVNVALPTDTVGLGALKDNTLYENAQGDLSNGEGNYFFAGVNGQGWILRAPIAFDVAGSVPFGATIVSVTLNLTNTTPQAVSGTVELYPLTTDWGEGDSNATTNPAGGAGGEGQGALAVFTDATWIHSFYTTTLWTTPGGDFLPTASVTYFVAGAVNGRHQLSSQGLITDVQTWLDDPANNFGWLIRNSDEVSGDAIRFASKDNTLDGLGYRPLLEIVYRLNQTPTVVADVYTTSVNSPLAPSAPGIVSNDNDPDKSDVLTADLVTTVFTGTLFLNGDGSFVYTPPTDFFGVVSFTYRVSDGIYYSGETLVTINVVCPTDAAVSAHVCIHIEGDDVAFDWLHNSDVLTSYQLHISTTPYFTPSVGTLTNTQNIFTKYMGDSHAGVIGNGVNYYYYIVAVNCPACADLNSNHMGKFEYALQAGDEADD